VLLCILIEYIILNIGAGRSVFYVRQLDRKLSTAYLKVYAASMRQSRGARPVQ